MKGRDEELLRYFDGELDARGARTVEERLAGSAEERAELEGLAAVRDAVQAHYEAVAEEQADRLAALWDRIDGALPAERPAAARAEGGVLAGLRAWLEGARGYALAGAVGVAAGALLVLALRPDRVTIVERPTVVLVPQPRPESPEPQVLQAQAESAEVESLEVAGGTGTVFQIPASRDDEAATTVIWITRDEPPSGPEGPI